jgi:hypothetical protein
MAHGIGNGYGYKKKLLNTKRASKRKNSTTAHQVLRTNNPSPQPIYSDTHASQKTCRASDTLFKRSAAHELQRCSCFLAVHLLMESKFERVSMRVEVCFCKKREKNKHSAQAVIKRHDE